MIYNICMKMRLPNLKVWWIQRQEKNKVSIRKRLISLLEGKKYSHTQAYYFLLDIIFNHDGTAAVYDKKKNLITKTKNIEELKNNKFDEIFVFGAGPSVRDMDLQGQQGDNFILVNGALSLAGKFPQKPLLCIVMDYGYVLKDFDVIKNLPEGCNLALTPDSIAAIYRKDKTLLLKFNVYLVFTLHGPYRAPERSEAELDTSKVWVNGNKTAAFSFTAHYGFYDGGSVITFAFQTAFMMHPKTTYIMGMDLGNYNQPYFYQDSSRGDYTKAVIGEYEEKIVPFMKLAAQKFKEAGIELYNCSPVSILPREIIAFNDKFVKDK